MIQDTEKRLEEFFKNFRRYNDEPEDFQRLAVNHLLKEILLETKDDQKRISKVKILFSKAYQTHQDEAGLYLLKLIEKAYELKEKNIAEGPGGNKHLGNAHYRATRQFRDYLMEIYWQLPDMKRAATDQYPGDDELRPIMLQTKFWILEQIANDWRAKRNAGSVIEKKASKRAFKFLIEVYNGIIQPNDSKNKSKINSECRFVPKKEKEGIIELIRSCDNNLKPEELEEWMQYPCLPPEIEKTLAIARTRNGGPELWRKDIQNAKILKPFFPDERTPTAMKLYKRFCQEIATLDNEAKALIVKMQESGLAERYEIGASEYVAGTVKFELTDLTAIIISVQLENDCSKELGDDIHGRARRHIEIWEYSKEKEIEVELKTYTDEENSDPRSFIWPYN